MDAMADSALVSSMMPMEAIALVILVWFAALIFVLVRPGAMPGMVKNNDAVVSGMPDEFLKRLTLAVGGLADHRVAQLGPHTVMIKRVYYARWRGVVAVLLFPIGLLAFVGRDDEEVTVVADAVGTDRTSVRMSGSFTTRLINAVNSVIDSLS